MKGFKTFLALRHHGCQWSKPAMLSKPSLSKFLVTPPNNISKQRLLWTIYLEKKQLTFHIFKQLSKI